METADQPARRAELHYWFHFLMAESHVLRKYPDLLWQQGANQPTESVVARRAASMQTRRPRPWFRWINRPREPSACLFTLLGHTFWISSVAFTSDGRRAVSSAGLAGRVIKVWNAGNGRRRYTLWWHRGDVEALAVTPDDRIVSGSQDGKVCVWDPVSRRRVLTLNGHTNWVSAVAGSPDGRVIVSGSWDETVKVWDAATGREIRTLRGHTKRIRKVAVTPDGRRIVSDSDDGTLRVWDAGDGRMVHTLESHTHFEAVTHGATPVPVTSDGRHVVYDSDARTINLWSLETGACVLRFPRHAGADHLATQDGIVAAGDQSGGVHILEMCGVETGPRLVTARRVRGRCVYRCPFCSADSEVADSELGHPATCAPCGRALRLNAFVVEMGRRRMASWGARLMSVVDRGRD